jgi:hypothetical protein
VAEAADKLSVLFLLKRYLKWLQAGEIGFVKKGSLECGQITNLVTGLIQDFRSAGECKGSLSDNLDWHETHSKGRELWHHLASSSLNQIDTTSKGNSELFEFLESATQFEELLYGLEPYYRDHTLHSLWVYLIGEYILRDLMPDIRDNLDWYIFNDVELEKRKYKKREEKQAVVIARSREDEVRTKVNKHQDAIWCIIALCHDLGYSLAKLSNINDRVKDVLKYFDVRAFQRIGYSLDIEHQNLVGQFLELMAMDVRIVPSDNYQDATLTEEERVLIGCYRDDSAFWQVCRAMEKKQHGILSSYLIYKILGIFGDTYIRGAAERWGLDNTEAAYNVIRGDILYAIAQHEFEFAHLSRMNGLAEILVLADELEEFSRYGREMVTRKYRDTAANASVSFTPPNPKRGKNIAIDMSYDFERSRTASDFFNFYWRKSGSLCRLFSLDQEDDKRGFSRISRITSTFRYKRRRLDFKISRSKKRHNSAKLPKTKIDGNELEAGRYDVSFLDDSILVHVSDEKYSLKKWCKYAY